MTYIFSLARRVYEHARDLITGLVYHAATAWVCVVFTISLLGTETYVFLKESNLSELKVSFLDVGQGDSILIQTPNRHLVLIDGGPSNSAVLSEIGKVIPFYRRRISIIMSTHPDSDHIGGLPKVIEKYNPTLFLEPGVRSDTWIDKKLRNMILQNNIDAIRARRGMKIHFGDTFLEILFPDRNVDEWTKKTNDASIVARLEYKDTSFMFTGDSPISIENYLNTTGYLKQTDVLKVGHHGSKTSTMDAFVKKLSPKYAVISSGRKNRYGHPHDDVINILKENEVTISSTAECGTIGFKSNGERVLPIDESCVVK